jgi:hypothetical protein
LSTEQVAQQDQQQQGPSGMGEDGQPRTFGGIATILACSSETKRIARTIPRQTQMAGVSIYTSMFRIIYFSIEVPTGDAEPAPRMVLSQTVVPHL